MVLVLPASKSDARTVVPLRVGLPSSDKNKVPPPYGKAVALVTSHPPTCIHPPPHTVTYFDLLCAGFLLPPLVESSWGGGGGGGDVCLATLASDTFINLREWGQRERSL